MLRYSIRLFSKALDKKDLLSALSKERITWDATQDAFRPFKTKVKDIPLELRINDFPDEPLYTVMSGDTELEHINGFKQNWKASSFPSPMKK